MSRHSKWAQIKHQKGTSDQKRGKLFTALSKRISIAARFGRDPETNPSLKLAVEKAKAANMPQGTITRAILRGVGELTQSSSTDEIIYEAHGFSGVQFIIVVLSDNRNRTTSNVRRILAQNNCSLTGSGSVMWNFNRIEDRFIPKSSYATDAKTIELVNKLIVTLEEDEDVDGVYTNIV